MAFSVCVILAAGCVSSRAARAEGNQILELRTYTLVDSAAEKKLDAYLEQALLPALLRQGLGPIGVFGQSGESEDGGIKVMVLVPGPDVESVTSATAKLSQDERYQQAAAGYLNNPAKEPIVKRIQSELLLSFDVWPKVVVPQQKNNNAPRLFELRIYESPTEKRGQLKVEMFNSGEVPIFLDCGVAPVFMGQALIGDKMPNLTYMTVYDSEAAREAAWKKFVKHPAWQTLSKIKKYDGTVSTIHKSDWRPKPYSQL
jgi:hypothetical protein